jgi:hypothetical protein
MEAICPDQFTYIVQSNDEDNGWIHSLEYMAFNGVSELCGIDLSDTQITTAKNLLEIYKSTLKLFQGPMEKDFVIPHNYFGHSYL